MMTHLAIPGLSAILCGQIGETTETPANVSCSTCREYLNRLGDAYFCNSGETAADAGDVHMWHPRRPNDTTCGPEGSIATVPAQVTCPDCRADVARQLAADPGARSSRLATLAAWAPPRACG